MGPSPGGETALTWDEVAALALAFPGAERSTSYGREAVKVRGKMIVVTGRTDDHFVLAASLDEVEMLMATDPACFFQTPHYAGWPSVLVGFEAADPDRIAALVERAWQRRASKAQRAARG